MSELMDVERFPKIDLEKTLLYYNKELNTSDNNENKLTAHVVIALILEILFDLDRLHDTLPERFSSSEDDKKLFLSQRERLLSVSGIFNMQTVLNLFKADEKYAFLFNRGGVLYDLFKLLDTIEYIPIDPLKTKTSKPSEMNWGFKNQLHVDKVLHDFSGNAYSLNLNDPSGGLFFYIEGSTTIASNPKKFFGATAVVDLDARAAAAADISAHTLLVQECDAAAKEAVADLFQNSMVDDEHTQFVEQLKSAARAAAATSEAARLAREATQPQATRKLSRARAPEIDIEEKKALLKLEAKRGADTIASVKRLKYNIKKISIEDFKAKLTEAKKGGGWGKIVRLLILYTMQYFDSGSINANDNIINFGETLLSVIGIVDITDNNALDYGDNTTAGLLLYEYIISQLSFDRSLSVEKIPDQLQGIMQKYHAHSEKQYTFNFTIDIANYVSGVTAYRQLILSFKKAAEIESERKKRVRNLWRKAINKIMITKGVMSQPDPMDSTVKMLNEEEAVTLGFLEADESTAKKKADETAVVSRQYGWCSYYDASIETRLGKLLKDDGIDKSDLQSENNTYIIEVGDIELIKVNVNGIAIDKNQNVEVTVENFFGVKNLASATQKTSSINKQVDALTPTLVRHGLETMNMTGLNYSKFINDADEEGRIFKALQNLRNKAMGDFLPQVEAVYKRNSLDSTKKELDRTAIFTEDGMSAIICSMIALSGHGVTGILGIQVFTEKYKTGHLPYKIYGSEEDKKFISHLKMLEGETGGIFNPKVKRALHLVGANIEKIRRLTESVDTREEDLERTDEKIRLLTESVDTREEDLERTEKERVRLADEAKVGIQHLLTLLNLMADKDKDNAFLSGQVAHLQQEILKLTQEQRRKIVTDPDMAYLKSATNDNSDKKQPCSILDTELNEEYQNAKTVIDITNLDNLRRLLQELGEEDPNGFLKKLSHIHTKQNEVCAAPALAPPRFVPAANASAPTHRKRPIYNVTQPEEQGDGRGYFEQGYERGNPEPPSPMSGRRKRRTRRKKKYNKKSKKHYKKRSYKKRSRKRRTRRNKKYNKKSKKDYKKHS